MRVAIGVMARAPLPGRCKTRLLVAHEASWVAGLYAAMLRDTLDGLLMVSADDYVVFAAPLEPAPGEEDDVETRTRTALDVLARHAPSPWELVAHRETSTAERVERALAALLARSDDTVAVLCASDSPSFPTEPLAEALAQAAMPGHVVVGPSESGGLYLLATRERDPRLLSDLAWGTPALLEVLRVRCKELGLTLCELPRWYQVREPSDVLTLLEEMRKHPDRAPRTAQFLVTRA
jgi:glycosyltransferase A (GT-A) superfamily protein (DUF2064 family)